MEDAPLSFKLILVLESTGYAPLHCIILLASSVMTLELVLSIRLEEFLK